MRKFKLIYLIVFVFFVVLIRITMSAAVNSGTYSVFNFLPFIVIMFAVVTIVISIIQNKNQNISNKKPTVVHNSKAILIVPFLFIIFLFIFFIKIATQNNINAFMMLIPLFIILFNIFVFVFIFIGIKKGTNNIKHNRNYTDYQYQIKRNETKKEHKSIYEDHHEYDSKETFEDHHDYNEDEDDQFFVKYCTECGQSLKKNEQFCPSCGKKVEK